MRKDNVSFKMAAAVVATMVVMLCGACGHHPKNAFTPADSKQAYETFLQEQQAATNKFNVRYFNHI